MTRSQREPMDTPNTRSRRKRELTDEDEGGTVKWTQDSRLRKIMMAASADSECLSYCMGLEESMSQIQRNKRQIKLMSQANAPEPLPIPCPTLRPVFRTITHPVLLRAPLVSALVAPNGRSHPNYPASPALRNAQPPNKAAGDGVLDELLDRAFQTFAVQIQPSAVAEAGTAAAKGARLSLPNPGEGQGRSGAFERQLSGGSGSGSSSSASASGSGMGSGSHCVSAAAMPRTRSPEDATRTAIVPTRAVLNDNPIRITNIQSRPPAQNQSPKPTPFPHPHTTSNPAFTTTTTSPDLTGPSPDKRPPPPKQPIPDRASASPLAPSRTPHPHLLHNFQHPRYHHHQTLLTSLLAVASPVQP
ncbi:uncharacterized protein MKK02DRAFT_30814 [Dioszegia hungarica]|uniref:Uncharacterized protein n=1 Tax=Dioszegia hungarica TaxID=4972 RepID=A0AA38LQQ1_9TREE|nr:uncharacterized protein MKK02DRAFT_30814 [Dioszegia hungarica]KAI9631813.1 hypothetical protein MKK02DRAFT_30814 [Dioszegia hungarica]